MTKLLPSIFLCLPIVATAQPPVMSQQDMQKMMENARKMQECMSRIDQSAVEAMASKAQEVERQIKSLCQAGRRDQAQKRAIEFGREMAANKEMQKMLFGTLPQDVQEKIQKEVEEAKKKAKSSPASASSSAKMEALLEKISEQLDVIIQLLKERR